MQTHNIEYRSLKISIEDYTAFINDEYVELTRKEMELLWLMASNPGKVFTRDNIIESLWGYDYEGSTRTIDSHIKRLRAKLKKYVHPYWRIKTVWGTGYKFEIDDCELSK